MIVFCDEIEQNRNLREQYHRRVRNLARWYKTTFERYSSMLKTEIGMETLGKELAEINVDPSAISEMAQNFLDDLDYANGSKMSYFTMSDALVKLMLSKFSFGPGPNNQFLTDCGITAGLKFKSTLRSWTNCSAGVFELAEIAAKVLRDKVGTYRIDFQALSSDREARSKLTHSGEASLCLSAMRCYNVVREMLVFMDPDYRDQLPFFVFEDQFDYDRMRADPCHFSFERTTTILIADSVHDVRKDYRWAVANLPWNLVIDLDGYSDCGGLLEMVEHNRIQREILCRRVSENLTQLPVDHTLWYRCGEYQSFDYIPEGNLFIGAYTEFHKDLSYRNRVTWRDKLNNLGEILKNLLLCAKACDRIINIVALTSNTSFVKRLLQVVNRYDVSLDDYFITWVGLASEKEANEVYAEYNGDQEDMRDHFCHHNCLTYQFYQAFAENSSQWEHRQSLESNFSLPSANGPVILCENERNNLANEFFPLYDHCEEENPERSEELRLQFYSGKAAAWNTIANEYVPRLRKNSEFDQMKNTIRTVLGQMQQTPQKRLFFINHTAGIGGSTLARQLVWELHMDFAVLEVRSFDPKTFKRRIEHLYDIVLDKSPIILFADDTLPFFKGLCDEVCRLDRRCVLVSACRIESGVIRTYPDANFKTVSSVQDSMIPILRERYRQVSPLPEAELRLKDTYFSEKIQGTMLTPFIIGLYYKEKDFNIDTYVRKALDGCYERRYADVLAYIALCDRYECKNLPISFVRHILKISLRDEYLRIVPSAGSLITAERQSSGAECYHFMHPLLSKCFLKQYCERYYGGEANLPNAIFELSYRLIDFMVDASKAIPENAPHLEILISIMIQNKRVNSDQSQYLSALMLDIGMPESQRQLMKHLAERFRPLADGIWSTRSRGIGEYFKRNEQQILRLVSHAYAHLGRMYSRDARNHAEAFECSKKAIDYMPDDDPDVFHMAGCNLIDKLKQKFYDSTEEFDQETLTEIYQDVQEAEEYFDNSICFGSPDYGYPSKLELLYEVLQFLFDRNQIKSEEDLHKLDPTARQMQAKFMNTLEDAKNYSDFNGIAQRKIADYESRFHSKIVFGNYSQAVEYYQNKVDILRNGHDIVGYGNSLRSLIYAQISHSRNKNPDLPFYFSLKNPRKMLTDIESLLLQPFDPERFSDYTLRTQMFHYWMKLAKYLDQPIDKGLAMARRWMTMEEDRHNQLNPEPYYYQRVLLYLSIKSGNTASAEELHDLIHRISGYDADNLFDRHRGKLGKIRDILVSGKEMGQLFDVTICKDEEEYLEFALDQSHTPVTVSAHFEDCLNQGLALLKIYDPVAWNKEQVRMNIGRSSQSSLTAAQVGHRVKFVLGFSANYLIALSHHAADIDAGEEMNLPKAGSLTKTSHASDTRPEKKELPSSNEASTKAVASAAMLKAGQRTVLRNISISSSSGRWINGHVDDGIAGVSVKDDLMRFPKEEISYYGGVDEVLKLLEKKAEIPCLIAFVVESGPRIRYRASLFEANGSIAEMLGETSKPKKKEPENIELSTKTKAEVPNGEVVSATIQTVQADTANCVFQYKGSMYSLVLKVSKKKERDSLQRAVKQKIPVKTRIVGYDKEIYTGKLV